MVLQAFSITQQWMLGVGSQDRSEFVAAIIVFLTVLLCRGTRRCSRVMIHSDLSDNSTSMSGSDDEDRSLLIVYATETGNAQDAADNIARQCRRIAFQCRVANIDSFSLVSLVFFISLTLIRGHKA